MRPVIRLSFVLSAVSAMILAGLAPPSAGTSRERTVRFASYNVSLNRTAEGELIDNLSEPYDGTDPDTSDDALRRWQAANVAEVIQRTRPDVLLLNEFDYDAGGEAIDLFRANYLEVGQNGADPIEYPYVYIAESNTGIPSGVDLDNDGTVGGPGDAYGFGFYPGQFGMAILSQYPIQTHRIRTFQTFLWKDMPGNLIPTDFYSDEAIEVLRLSSKSHWDVPVYVRGARIHFLVSHPTPPVFDGPEDRNGRRNHDEIRFWSDYVGGKQTSRY
ncbi:MAG: endonuclease/exonuclease/phosphatase family protein, partial [Actinomycetota bacterium]